MFIWAIVNIILIVFNILVLAGIGIMFSSLYQEIDKISKHTIIMDCTISSINSKLGYIERISESAMRRLVAIETKVGIHGAV